MRGMPKLELDTSKCFERADIAISVHTSPGRAIAMACGRASRAWLSTPLGMAQGGTSTGGRGSSQTYCLEQNVISTKMNLHVAFS